MSRKRHILITGGAGFIGTNSADHFLSRGWTVTVLDNFSRSGSRDNLAWLSKKWGKELTSVRADVSRDVSALEREVRRADAVLHLAGQVAVTTSVADPQRDFRENALGTLNVLEAIRQSPSQPPIMYASTNKVYGEMTALGTRRTRDGWRYRAGVAGVSERQSVDFHSPYGCSKGAADQYVHDYARIYGLKTVVFRQSCIFGPHQFGMEEQGWVAWFAIAALFGRPITVYGDGYQTRDVLDVSDVCRLYETAFLKIEKVKGRIYNIGGGPSRAVSVRGVLALLAKELGRPVPHAFGDWRPGDQKVYISDIRAIARDLGWRPAVSVAKGMRRLVAWIREEEPRVRRVL
ncbi:MAG: CDP-paratose 2-epimerase [Candidatus Sungbacteria bacterium RIFCSPLOWO2_02_FULL_54_10]|uniref:CDP-paratose 2-epimerase n=2 Tax=Candidatus Sungiibacteriota TaxID=1817917 RepID=A0A1G2L9I2_9BACT|nr:MAG: CDP-paratose 2-epimerase [Candidatus Sungbacteria bacterium RIFCSPHIGHO2_01_FULL_54_26]OHA03250.1 MAG: CDP-paratose 2-epimerase [Candidatus Sungbacteria bacterium RIFCSPHIGHO2_02_FULL_53_17]OHA07439.1 MAG: CDP-paratose 2-epimerase [Candidatus Sungbacteria bacterium RIFCSPLOWO2_01_FULL_54_21]OHA12123.1 MAG: CDP-paratose 2-epimerase [Candidatus Sungbacteria bacterium RIFCSPLOWO2_02_FULL_54_10]